MNARSVIKAFGILCIALVLSMSVTTASTYAVGVDKAQYQQAQDFAKSHNWDAVAIIWPDSNSADVEVAAVDLDGEYLNMYFPLDGNVESPNCEWFVNYNSVHFQYVGERLHGNVKDNVPQFNEFFAL